MFNFLKLTEIIMCGSLCVMIITLCSLFGMFGFVLIGSVLITIERFLLGTEYSSYIILLGPIAGLLVGVYFVWKNFTIINETIKEGTENSRYGVLIWVALLLLKKGISSIRKPKHS